jgi:hypothetical protein
VRGPADLERAATAIEQARVFMGLLMESGDVKARSTIIALDAIDALLADVEQSITSVEGSAPLGAEFERVQR